MKVLTAELNVWFLMGASKMRYGYNLNIIRMWMVILGWGEPQRRNGLHPALLWSDCGVHCPELQKLATRILSQTCDGASRYKLKRSLAENLLAKGRNPIGQGRLCDLTFVHYNLHLRNADWSTDTDHEFGEIDPMNDWIVWEGPSTSQSNVEPRLCAFRRHDWFNYKTYFLIVSLVGEIICILDHPS